MEKQLKCALLLSLKEMCLRRVAVFFWSDSDILASIWKTQLLSLSDAEREEWQNTVERKIKDKMLKLELPKSLMKQMIDIVRPIGLQIRRWKECQEEHLYIEIQEMSLPDSAKLCWTTAGTINYRKTAEELVRCDVFDVVPRYLIACSYCLEDYITLLWEELPEQCKKCFLGKGLMWRNLELCWPYIIRGELSKLDYLLRRSDRNLTTFNQWAFEQSAEKGNKTATEYFFQKLTHEEREASLMRTVEAVLRNRLRIHFTQYPFRFRYETFSDLLCYLICLMTPEQQMELVKALPVHVLLCFLYWPWQDLFLENVGLIWTFLPRSGFNDLLQDMTNRFENSGHYFPKLFQEFFMQSPLYFKKCFVYQEFEWKTTPACRFLSIFFRSEDSESIEVIFRNLDAADRVELVFHRCVLELFYNCILRDRLHMVEVCLREATLSKGDRERLKEAFMVCNYKGQIEWESRDLKRFFDFLDGTNASADKEKKAQKRKLENCCPE